MLSIPSGTREVGRFAALMETCREGGLEVYEGAQNNLPDLDSEAAARFLRVLELRVLSH